MMTPYYDSPEGQIYHGHALEVLRQLPDEAVHCVITSPPYWGLRDYQVDGQLGLEKTPEEYIENMVQIFREVKRVLRSDGTIWVNMGDSYAASRSYQVSDNKHSAVRPTRHLGRATPPNGYKQKDLIGIPWALAKALRDPYYTGRIKNESDRVWLAAMVDGEGCMFIHKRKAGTPAYSKYRKKDGVEVEYKRTKDTYGVGLEVANTHLSIIERCKQITGMGSICRVERESKNKKRNLPLYRWNMRTNQCREIIKEIYPYLVGKRHEARLILGCPSSGDKAELAHSSLINLHNGFNAAIDFPEPKSMYEPGFYLRQDIIWSKLNPMPESVKDRCTKAHEYIFLLSKSARYFYDAEAIKESSVYPNDDRVARANATQKRAPTDSIAGIRPRIKKLSGWDTGPGRHGTIHRDGRMKEAEYTNNCYPERNKRSVWTIATQPMPDAHFATFPEKLIEPCVLAGCPEGGTVLDPFFGSGTTGIVAYKHGRKFIGIELSKTYLDDIAIPRLKKETRQLKLFA